MDKFFNYFQLQVALFSLSAFLDLLYNVTATKKKMDNKWADFWVDLETLSWPTIQYINNLFVAIFKATYGNHILSFRRILTSTLSSVFFLFFIFYIFLEFGDPNSIELNIKTGPMASTVIPDQAVVYSINGIKILLYYAIFINLIPDFVSLAETGWILKLSRNKRMYIFPLLLADISLTAIIFIVWNFFLFNLDPTLSEWAVNSSILDLYFSKDYSAPIYPAILISTFATSLLWFLFIVVVIFFAVLKKISKTISNILESSIFFHFPISVMMIILSFCGWPVFFIYHIIFN